MSTRKMILLRIFNITLGRIPFFSRLLRKFLVKIMIKNKKDKYVASSKFFDWKDLE
jgi:hypothetical protein